MTLLQLKYITTVAEYGSISVAARNLMISQPALSQSIRNVEKEYNVTLFERGSIPLVPTKAGLVFLNKAHIILTALQSLEQDLQQLETAPKELSIGVSDAGMLINKRIFPQFQQCCPGVKLRVVERDQYLLERMLEAGKLDIIFTMEPRENPNLTVISLVEDEFMIALPKSHPVSKMHITREPGMIKPDGTQCLFPSIDLDLCQDVCFVVSGRERLNYVQLSALRTAFEPQISFETNALASAVSIAAQEPHGAIVPKLFSVLYEGPEHPCFFRSSKQLPLWNFAMSIKKGRRLSDAGFQYIRLFITQIHSLGLLCNSQALDAFLDTIKKQILQTP